MFGEIILLGISLCTGNVKFESKDILDYLNEREKKEVCVDFHSLDFLLHDWGKKFSKEISKKTDVNFEYREPINIFDYGKNKVRWSNFNWKGLKIEKNVDMFFDEKLEEKGNENAKIVKETIDKYRNFFDYNFNNKLTIFVYNSHKFRETNILPFIIPTGIGGFFEKKRNVIVVPYNREVEHVLKHEIVHAFLHGKAKTEEIPIWFDEGLAEYLSNGFDRSAENIMRDITINNRIIDVFEIPYSYIMYKASQSFFYFLVEKYGKEKLKQYIENICSKKEEKEKMLKENIFGDKRKVNVEDEALLVYGKKLIDLSKEWKEWLKNRYYSDYISKVKVTEINDISQDITNLYMIFENNRLAYLTFDNVGRTCIKIIESDDFGKIRERKIVDGNEIVELIDIGRFDMNSNYLVFSGFIGGRDNLFVYDIKNGKIKKYSFKNIVDINDPTISFDSKYIAFSGQDEYGNVDIFLFETNTGKLTRLTNDTWFEGGLDFSPNSYDIVFYSNKHEDMDIFLLKNMKDLIRLTSSKSDDWNPRFRKNGNIVFISDRNTVQNVFEVDRAGNIYVLTDFICPIEDVYVSVNKNGKEVFLVNFLNDLRYRIGIVSKEKKKLIGKESDFEKKIKHIHEVEKFEDVKFKRRYLAHGIFYTNNGLMFGLHVYDILGDKHAIFAIGGNERDIRDIPIYLLFMDIENRLKKYFGLNKLTYVKYLPKIKTHINTKPPLEGDYDSGGFPSINFERKSMNIVEPFIAIEYPFSQNRRIENILKFTYSDKNSEDFFKETWYKKIWKELPEYKKGWRISTLLSLIYDEMIYNFKGPIDGYGYRIEGGFKVKPVSEIVSMFLNTDFRIFKKTNIGVVFGRVACGYGYGKEFEDFGIGDITTIKGYGKIFGLTFSEPEFYGKGYYLINLGILQYPIISNFILPDRKIVPGIDMCAYIDIGNVFDEYKDISSPKMSIGLGISTYFLPIIGYTKTPLTLYFSIPFEMNKGINSSKPNIQIIFSNPSIF